MLSLKTFENTARDRQKELAEERARQKIEAAERHARAYALHFDSILPRD